MSKNWSDFEVNEIVIDYFDMLSKEIKQVNYKKSGHRMQLKKKLSNRSDGSIEFKHQNISAILIKYGRPYIIGYKPRSNYQKNLEVMVLNYLERNNFIEKDFELFAGESNKIIEPINFDNWVEPIPRLLKFEEAKVEFRTRIAHVNYIEKEQANKLLGEQGEELVVQYEKWRLIKAGKESLADKVEWISKDYGDGAGFDILSKNSNGADRYIEVKTTKLGKYTPIYLTRNELAYSKEKESSYYLYRLFEFNKAPKMFNSKGSLDEICTLEPLNYVGRFK
ncbi:MAG: DUF3883 domain-containing protein [Saprospiraceae bacterium]